MQLQRIPLDKNSLFVTLMMGAFAAFMVISIVLFPAQAFQASLQGLSVWWKIVFPSLLPFLVISEIMIAYGLIHAFGAFADPLMRLIFRLPGIGGWTVALGFTTGYPSGAKAACQMRKLGLVTRLQGERLLTLTHVCNPIFLISVVAVGFFHQASFGMVLLAIHWLSAMATALIMEVFIKEPAHEAKQVPENLSSDVMREYTWIGELAESKKHLGLLRRIWFAQRLAKAHDGRTFGKIMGDAVSSSIQTLMSIGGYMMLFSVLLKMAQISRLSATIAKVLENILAPFGMPVEFSRSMIAGLFELHIGAYEVSQTDTVSFLWQAAILSALIAWSGFAHHAVVKSIMSGTDLRYSVFFWSKMLHSVVAATFTFLLWTPLSALFHQAVPTFLMLNRSFGAGNPDAGMNLWSLWQDPVAAMYWPLGFIIVMIVLSAMIAPFQRSRKNN